MILSQICRLSPHVARPFCSTLKLVRKEDRSCSTVPSNDGLTQSCSASPAALSSVIMFVEGILLARVRS